MNKTELFDRLKNFTLAERPKADGLRRLKHVVDAQMEKPVIVRSSLNYYS